MTTASTAPPARRAHSDVAQPHTRRAPAHAAWALLLPLAAACGPEPGGADDAETTTAPQSFAPHKGRDLVRPDGTIVDAVTHIPRDAPVPQEARDKMREFLEAMVMPPLDETSDIHDAWFHRTQKMLADLKAESEDVGNAALHAFVGDASDHYHTRRALLIIGAHAAPRSAAGLFHELTFTYGYRIEDRSEACALLGRVDPEGFMAKAEEVLKRRGRKTQTMPEDEFFLAAWLEACERTNTSPVDMCADVATNMWMQPYARYVALTELGKHTSHPLARHALETCLIESSGDGMLRQKAAQAIRDGYPREQGCALFEDVLAKEASSMMRSFLTDMIAAHCGGGGDGDE